MKAFLKNYRQSPRKVRLLADLVRGKKVNQALVMLDIAPKRASDAVIKLIKSAKANAIANDKANEDELFIKSIEVNKAPTLKRFRPRARGSASRINKRQSHLTVVLDTKK